MLASPAFKEFLQIQGDRSKPQGQMGKSYTTEFTEKKNTMDFKYMKLYSPSVIRNSEIKYTVRDIIGHEFLEILVKSE